MLNFCDEVCVVDCGSTDGTIEKLQELSEKESKLKLKVSKKDFNDKRFAVQVDGLLKAEARKMCTSDFCWQMDSDEIVPDGCEAKIVDLAKKMSKNLEIISLPVIDLWGKNGKVRIDVTPWKWRLSRNSKNITHGIPKELRRYDEEGKLYAATGTDSCDMIYEDSGERVPHATFISQESEKIRHLALNGDQNALSAYENWINQVIDNLPHVVHYSWQNLPRKIKTYQKYWSRFWESMYNIPQIDTKENNMFFDKPWVDVTDEEIQELANRLENIGGWVWHRKWDGTKTPHIKVKVNH